MLISCSRGTCLISLNTGCSPLYNDPSTDGKTPQPVFKVESLEAMELFLCPKLPGLDLFKMDDRMPLLHYCVTYVRGYSPKCVTTIENGVKTFHMVHDEDARLRSLVSKKVLQSLADQINMRWSKVPDEPSVTPGTY